MIDISKLTDQISALKTFKDQINTAIRDEQEAQAIYSKMTTQADKAGARSDSSEIRGIRDQEHTHETKFRNMLKNTEQSITEFERKVKEEQKKQAEEKRRKEEQERQRKEQESRRIGAGARSMKECCVEKYKMR
jgi:rubrerythrin